MSEFNGDPCPQNEDIVNESLKRINKVLCDRLGTGGGGGGGGDASAANQLTEIARLTSILAQLAAGISVTGALTDAELRASSVEVSLPGNQVDLDTGIPTDMHDVVAIGAPGVSGMQIAQIENTRLQVNIPPYPETIAKLVNTPATGVDVGVPALVIDTNGNYVVPIVTSNGSLITNDEGMGVRSEAPATDDTGTFSLIALFKRLLQRVAQDGTDITTPSPAMPAGGAGIRGWLSAIWTKINTTLAVTQSGVWSVATLSPTPGGASMTKLEDVASANFDMGIPAMAIQKATPADTAGTDGDYAMLQMKDGRLWVRDNGAASVDVIRATASTSAATLAIARATRRGILIRNLDTAITIYVKDATVTTANGFPLLPGESVPLGWTGLIQVISASGTPAYSAWDEYD